jgi:hypothetical protein
MTKRLAMIALAGTLALGGIVSGCSHQQSIYQGHSVEFDKFGGRCSIGIYSTEKLDERMSSSVNCKTGKVYNINPNNSVSDLNQFANPEDIQNIFKQFNRDEQE